MRSDYRAAGLIAILVCLLLPGAAVASTVSSDGSTVTVTAPSGQANVINATVLNGNFIITDSAGITAGTGCSLVSSQVRCPSATVTALNISTDDLADRVTLPSVNAVPDSVTVAISGGTGNDVLTSQGGDDTLTGGAGSDTLSGGRGDDSLDGGINSDIVNGGFGDDILSGGNDTYTDSINGDSGTDTVTYAARTTGVTVTLDGINNDGIVGLEKDNVYVTVENVIGGAGNDSLSGNGNANLLSGMGGNDTLHAAAGADVLLGGDGDDQLQSADSESDQDSCGNGTDSVAADDADQLDPDCESVSGLTPAVTTPAEPVSPLPTTTEVTESSELSNTTTDAAPAVQTEAGANASQTVNESTADSTAASTPSQVKAKKRLRLISAAMKRSKFYVRRAGSGGTKFVISINRAARVAMSIEKLSPAPSTAAKELRHCKRVMVQPHKAARAASVCRRVMLPNWLSWNAKSGVSTKDWDGTIGGVRKLTPGRYLARVRATDRAGEVSQVRTLHFTVTR